MVAMSTGNDGGMQVCGCAVGRPCTCGYSLRRAMMDAAVVAVADEDVIEIAPGVVLRLKKEYFDDVQGTRLYRLMHQYRLSLRDAIALLSSQLVEFNETKKQVALELTLVAGRKRRLDEANADTKERKKDSMSKRDLQEIMHMTSAFADMNTNLKTRPQGFVPSSLPVSIFVLEPHLHTLHAVTTAATQKAKTEMQGCRDFVFHYAMTRIQAMARGWLGRRHHIASFVSLWCGAELAAAVTIQLFLRKCSAIRRVDDRRRRFHHVRCWNASIHVQRTMRGFLGRRQAATRRRMATIQQQVAAAVTLQCWVRCITAFQLVDARRQIADARRAALAREDGARCIQRVFRGHRGRRRAKQTRIEANLSDPVKALVDQFKAKGDFWDLVKTIDKDYRQFAMDRELENDNATTFVTKVLRERRQHQEEALQAWHVSRAMESPVVAHQRRVDSAYDPSTASARRRSPSPSRKTTDSRRPVAPYALLEGTLTAAGMKHPTSRNDAIHLNQIAPETMDAIPDKYSPQVIRHAMAQGFAVPDILAALYVVDWITRGLDAAGKSTRNVKLLVRELRRRTPLMLNPFKSERVVRAAVAKYDAPTPATSSSTPLATSPMTLSTAETPDTLTLERESDIVHGFIVHSLHDGLDEPIGNFTFVAAMLVFVPPLLDFDGDHVTNDNPWTSTPNSHFATYVHLGSTLLKIRREQLVTAAIAPVLDTFKAKGFVHGHDLDNTHVSELEAWHVPRGLAASLCYLVAKFHKIDATLRTPAMATAAPRTRPPPPSRMSTADTIAYDVTSREATPAAIPPPMLVPTKADAEMARFVEMKTRIEATAWTPVTPESPLFDLFFQALFVLVPFDVYVSSDHSTTHALSPAHYDAFIHRLLEPDLTIHTTHRLVQLRSQRTATLARDYSHVCKAAGCTAVKDIIYRPLDEFHLPDVLADQVRLCMSQALFEVVPTRRASDGSMCRRGPFGGPHPPPS
ncbi:Aste57867_20123 [Aphanomyces stellatus]|uniref:Aste57867_20123 protein n=1 Tax=Aphanomyces stellatus TaxID=120398 RepID=A0A485LG71_9STRA|nr:hypothetical protein As57867_020057 [Aphanomyces stellatus]VFT96818.1 Aste57867_20123 [Aphanomyces stellatus]